MRGREKDEGHVRLDDLDTRRRFGVGFGAAEGSDRLLAVSPMAGTWLSTDGGATWRRDDERLDWAERELVKRIGERLYGRPAGRHVGS